jgi:hypothetical protein
MARGEAYDDRAELRQRADLHGVGGRDRSRGERAGTQTDDDGVAGPGDSGREQPDEGDSGGGGGIRHASTVAAATVTAQARRVPDV